MTKKNSAKGRNEKPESVVQETIGKTETVSQDMPKAQPDEQAVFETDTEEASCQETAEQKRLRIKDHLEYAKYCYEMQEKREKQLMSASNVILLIASALMALTAALFDKFGEQFLLTFRESSLTFRDGISEKEFVRFFYCFFFLFYADSLIRSIVFIVKFLFDSDTFKVRDWIRWKEFKEYLHLESVEDLQKQELSRFELFKKLIRKYPHLESVKDLPKQELSRFELFKSRILSPFELFKNWIRKVLQSETVEDLQKQKILQFELFKILECRYSGNENWITQLEDLTGYLAMRNARRAIYLRIATKNIFFAIVAGFALGELFVVTVSRGL